MEIHLATDAISTAAPAAHAIIDLHDDEQLAALSKTLQLGQDVLREAIKAFGPSLQKLSVLLAMSR